MPRPEFDQLMSECESLAIELQSCTDPSRRVNLLKQMKVAIDAANAIALEPPDLKARSATP